MAKGPLGTGRRFRALEAKLAGKPGVRNPAAVAAAIGRQKYGAKRMAVLAQEGKRRKAAEAATGIKPKRGRVKV